MTKFFTIASQNHSDILATVEIVRAFSTQEAADAFGVSLLAAYQHQVITDEDEFDLLRGLKPTVLAKLYNVIPGVKPVNKFTDTATAFRRTTAALAAMPLDGAEPIVEVTDEVTEVTEAPKAPEAPAPKKVAKSGKTLDSIVEAKKAKIEAKKAPAVKRQRGISLNPHSKLVQCREGSKQARLIDLLAAEQGATLHELHMAMNGQEFSKLKGWTLASTRSALNFDVNSLKGYGIRTEFWTKAQLAEAGRAEGDSAEEAVAVYFLVYPKGVSAPLAHKALAKKEANNVNADAKPE